MTILETNRLILRPWRLDDALQLYQYAKDSRVGPAAGWPAHHSVQESKSVIENVLMTTGTFAMAFKETPNMIIGNVGLKFTHSIDYPTFMTDKSAEIGYWIGVPFWGQGLMPEAVNRLLLYGFNQLELAEIWGGYYEGNQQSRRVQEKCGLSYQLTVVDKYVPLLKLYKDEHFLRITREEWQNK